MKRSRAAPQALVALAALVASGVAGCEGLPEDSCIARGSRTDLHGSLDSTLTIAATAPMLASTETTLTVVDYTRLCSYDQEEFPVELLGCRLWVRLKPKPADQDVVPSDAVVVGGQGCTLALPQGAVTVSIGSGSLTFPDGVATFTLDGAVGALNGASALGTAHLTLVADQAGSGAD